MLKFININNLALIESLLIALFLFRLTDTGDHATSLDALWALRDFLTCDTLGITKLV